MSPQPTTQSCLPYLQDSREDFPRRALTPIHNKTVQTIAIPKSGKRGRMKFNMSKAKKMSGRIALIITKNASIPL
jgi:hypothetical protein